MHDGHRQICGRTGCIVRLAEQVGDKEVVECPAGLGFRQDLALSFSGTTFRLHHTVHDHVVGIELIVEGAPFVRFIRGLIGIGHPFEPILPGDGGNDVEEAGRRKDIITHVNRHLGGTQEQRNSAWLVAYVQVAEEVGIVQQSVVLIRRLDDVKPLRLHVQKLLTRGNGHQQASCHGHCEYFKLVHFYLF